MFNTIFSFEFKRWFSTWQLYIYMAAFFFLGFFLMGSAIGFWDTVAVTTTSLTKMNSPLMISGMIEGTNQLLYFLFPTIIGAGIYRDFKYNAHQIFFSYPFTKTSYLMGKFWSGFFITLIISILIGVGMFLATLMPFANQELLGPHFFWNYAQTYLLNVIPNMLLMGAIIFTVTTLSRSVYVGFATTVALVIIINVVSNLSGQLDNKVLTALLDPSGMSALSYYTDHWTINDVNTRGLPVEKYYIFNRLIWLAVASFFLILLARLFEFSHHPISIKFWKRPKGRRLSKNNFIGLFKIELPRVKYNYSLRSKWANIWAFTKFNFAYLIKNKVVLILMVIGVAVMILNEVFSGSMFGTKTLPVTVDMLKNEFSLQFFIIILTFLGAGLLVHRGKLFRMDGLTDSTSTPNWVFFTSKYFALILFQAALLLLVMIGGIIIQAYNGYFQFEIGLYLKRLIGISLFSYIIWGGLALAVQTLFRNYILGFFVLLIFYLFGDAYSKLGVELSIFFFNRLPGVGYSDLNGFSSALSRYYIYALYWLFFIGFLSGLTLIFWRRGVFKFRERFYFAKKRATAVVVLPALICLIGFLSIGGYIYYEKKIQHPYYSAKENELQSVTYEKKYKKYENLILPRITDVKVNVDLYPETRDFKAEGRLQLKNKNAEAVDTLLLRYASEYENEISVEGATFVSQDSLYGFQLYKFKEPLDSGEVAALDFKIKNRSNTVLRNNSPVLNNGTFINNFIFPSLGYAADQEISDTQLREKYNLPPKDRMKSQDDMEARQNTYIRDDSDWITFETTVSTSEDQIAIAPGYLQKEWVEDGRRYFHYDMGDQKILNFYAYNSGTYEVEKEEYDDVNLEIYYNKKHPHNIDRMMRGLKRGMDYFTKEFSPYQFEQVRIIEFPSSEGAFAQSFANTVPFSEAMGFIADVEKKENAVDYPFSVTAHELAHQWWAHQVIGANVQGGTMLSESLAEYSSLKVLEHENGKEQMRKFLKHALDDYLTNRRFENVKEQPLMYNENQQYIHYEKGSLVFYAMSDYLGEEKLNTVLSNYIDSVAFQDPPYTTSGELVNALKKETPDSLQYLITDMFETITLYDNYIEDAKAKKKDNDKFEVDIKAIVSKYRAGDQGEKFYANIKGDSLVYTDKKEKEIKSLPIADYIEIGIFGKKDNKKKEVNKEENEKVLYLEKIKFSDIENDLKIEVDEKPVEVGIDPFNKLIDGNSDDNRKKVKVQ